jgi:hypothetical protein
LTVAARVVNGHRTGAHVVAMSLRRLRQHVVARQFGCSDQVSVDGENERLVRISLPTELFQRLNGHSRRHDISAWPPLCALKASRRLTIRWHGGNQEKSTRSELWLLHRGRCRGSLCPYRGVAKSGWCHRLGLEHHSQSERRAVGIELPHGYGMPERVELLGGRWCVLFLGQQLSTERLDRQLERLDVVGRA